jgi:hypothetical protein
MHTCMFERDSGCHLGNSGVSVSWPLRAANGSSRERERERERHFEDLNVILEIKEKVHGLKLPRKVLALERKPCRSATSYDAAARKCVACESGQFVLDPDSHSCMTCPRGARCSSGVCGWHPQGVLTCEQGDSIVGQWRPDYDRGVLVLDSCPDGHTKIASPLDDQWCKPCSPAQYVLDPNSGSCMTCPRGALCSSGVCGWRPSGEIKCHNGDESITGTWRADRERGVLLLDNCPSGHAKVNSTLENQYCKPCTPIEYIIDPGQHVCQSCPIGARCDGSTIQGPPGILNLCCM